MEKVLEWLNDMHPSLKALLICSTAEDGKGR